MTDISYLEAVARGLTKVSPSAALSAGRRLAEMIILILDASGSMATSCGRTSRLGAAQDASIAMVRRRIELGADDQLAVLAFDLGARTMLPFTRCREQYDTVERAIRSITSGGGTDLAAPLALACRFPLYDGRVHIVLLSDGQGGDPAGPANELKRRGVVIETIGVGNDPSEVDEPILRGTASVFNGKVLYRFIRDAGELMVYFETEIANRLARWE